jgi:hypothetical protein
MSSSPATGPSAELIRYPHGSTRIGRTCMPYVTPMSSVTRGSVHPRMEMTFLLACMNDSCSTSPEAASATGRSAAVHADPASVDARQPTRASRFAARPGMESGLWAGRLTGAQTSSAVADRKERPAVAGLTGETKDEPVFRGPIKWRRRPGRGSRSVLPDQPHHPPPSGHRRPHSR